MITIVACLGFVLIVLIGAEYLRRVRKIQPERARRLVHIIVGTSIAFWPYFMSLRTIAVLSILMFFVVSLSRVFGIFTAIHNVKRRTIGDLLFPVSIVLVALLAESSLIFTAAVLCMAVADGLAAIIGSNWKTATYKLFSQRKSVGGSMVFFVTATGVLLIVGGMMGLPASRGIAIALIATIVEAGSVYGFDDIGVPLVVTIGLNLSI